MKRFQILGCTLIAVFAFGVISAASASAETAFWLEDGVAITALESTVTKGTVFLTNLALGSEVTVKCVGEFVGSVGANGEDEITEVISNGKKSGTPLTGEDILCEVTVGGLCTLKSDAEVWPVQLPWHTHLLLVAPIGTNKVEYLDILLAETNKIPGYEVKCSGPLGAFSNECKGQTSSGVENTATISMNGVFSAELGTEAVPCTLGEGITAGEGLLELLSALTLTASMTLP